MKFAVLANNEASFVRPLSQGLAAMIGRVGHEAEVFLDGHDAIYNPKPELRFAERLKLGARRLIGSTANDPYARFMKFAERLKAFDVIVVVGHLPLTLAAKHFRGIELLREMMPSKVIVNYDLCSWQVTLRWLRTVKTEPRYGGSRGFSRYDWYWTCSCVGDVPVLPALSFPESRIGMDVRTPLLYPEQNGEFRVLVDFDRPNYPQARHLQIQALEELKMPYTTLKGNYPQEELRALMRKHSALMLSHLESFGLPIIEMELCGGTIFMPDVRWAPSHYLKPNTEPGTGPLGSNFKVYEDNVESLKSALLGTRENFSAERNLRAFQQEYPHLYSGDEAALKASIDAIASGQINSKSHQGYAHLDEALLASDPNPKKAFTTNDYQGHNRG